MKTVGLRGVSLTAIAAVVSVAPSTLNFPFASVAPAIWGPVDATTNAARTFVLSNGKAGLSLLVTGTAATLDVRRSTGSSAANMVLVSIDGAAETALSPTGTVYTLFSGLSQATRLVQIRIADSWGGVIYLDESLPALMTVTGAPPSISTPAAWVGALDGNALAVSTGFKVVSSAGFVPTHLPTGLLASPQGSAIPTVRFRSSTTSLLIVGRSRRVFVSINGGAATRYDTTIADGALRSLRVPGLTGTNDISVWAGTTSGSGNSNPLFVGLDAPLIDLATKAKLIGVGDSIQQGQGATCPGNVDTLQIAANLGYAGMSSGINGQNPNDIRNRIDAFLAGVDTNPATDVITVCMGRNGATSGFAAWQTDFEYVETACLVKAAKVLFIGLMPEAGDNFAAFNAAEQAWVSTRDTSRVKYIETSDLTMAVVSRPDGVHPDDPGYGVRATILTPRIAAAIA